MNPKNAPILVAVIGAVIALIVSFIPAFIPDFDGISRSKVASEEITDLNAKVDKLEIELSQLQSNVSTGNASAVDVGPFRVFEGRSGDESIYRYEEYDKRLSVVEKAIIDSPERSLALYKLSNDIEDLKEDRKSDLEDTKKEIDRIYSFSQWFMVGMFSIAVSLIGLAWNMMKKNG